MPTYQEKQFELFEQVERGQADSLSIVPQRRDHAADVRMCLTALVFFSKNLQDRVTESIIQPLAEADPEQYYYPPESMHVTIQNVRNINEPPHFSEQDVEKVKIKFREIIPRHQRFSMSLKGLFQLPTSIALRGYTDEQLRALVMDLRQGLIDCGVPDDKKYASEKVFFGSSTICRVTQRPNAAFYEQVKNLKEVEVGKLEIQEIALITTNAVCHPRKTVVISCCALG